MPKLEQHELDDIAREIDEIIAAQIRSGSIYAEVGADAEEGDPADVRFYDIFDADDELRGSFYLDLYAREHKQGGAWMDVCLGRRYRQDGSLQKPVAYLTCNFNGTVDGKPALFTHNEVVTLFHEFGHGIHHMLTRIDVAGVAGFVDTASGKRRVVVAILHHANANAARPALDAMIDWAGKQP